MEPEIWFRIVHLAQDAQGGAPVAPYREQTVEIALGSKGAFENGSAVMTGPEQKQSPPLSGNPMTGQSPTIDVRPVATRPFVSAFGGKRLF